MAKARAIPPAFVIKQVETDKLRFDAKNPRLAGNQSNPEQLDLLKTLWAEFSVDEIALSIAANRFFRHEPLFAAPENGALVVIEGNRRLAAVRLLCDGDLRKKIGATDLPSIDAALKRELEHLPVVECTREDVWRYLGFKHVNGPQAWNADSKAEYISWVRNTLKIPLKEIARTIGDKHQTVERLYHAKMVLEQAERAKVFNSEDRWKKHFSFSHLYTGLGYAGIQKFLGVRDSDSSEKDKDPIHKGKIEELGELLQWLYGSKSKNREPLIQSQNPDLRNLDEVLQKRDGVVALRRGLPLQVSLDIARGDEQLFREAVQGSKQQLQKALGTVLTGYDREEDLFKTADEIVRLSQKLLADMQDKRNTATTTKSKRS